MKFFIDTANVNDIKQAVQLGVVSGVTTNPTLIAREGRDLVETLKEIAGIIPDDAVFFGEVNSLDAEEMVKEARELTKISPKIAIKIPMCAQGLKAISMLKKEGIKTNCTLIFTSNQALLAARAGASYVSPFVGRLDDIGIDGTELIADCAEIFAIHEIDCEIISASVRTPLHVIESAKLGAHIATIPPSVLMKIIEHPLTKSGIEAFVNDWNELQAKL